MRCFIRPYNEARLLQRAIRGGARPSGIAVDAHAWRLWRDMCEELRQGVPDDYEKLLDPVTGFAQKVPAAQDPPPPSRAAQKAA